MSSNKKKAVDNNTNRDSDSGGESSDNENEQNVYTGGEEIQVDFEGRNPQDSDFHGIKQLLQQLFLKAHVNLSKLADIIISQNYVGSVVKQSDNDPEDDGDDEMTDVNDVFGVTSVINITQKQNEECIQELRHLLTELAQEHAPDSVNTLIRQLLADESHPVGFIINERFVNIPAQISVPLLESLHNEIQRATKKNMPFNFTYYILICKLYKPEEKGTRIKDSEIIWSNPEEEVIFPEALASFEFSVKNESDSGHSGHWLEEDASMVPYRKVLILEAKKFDDIIDTVKSYVNQV